MQCGSCVEVIPDDSIFCPECGARQEMSRAGGFTSHNAVGLGGQDVSGGRSFGVVSGEAIRQQREEQGGAAGNLPADIMQQIAHGIQNQQNMPPGNLPPQNQQFPPQNQQFPPQNQQFPPQNQQFPPQNQQFPPQNQQFPPQNQQFPPQNRNVIPSALDGQKIIDGAMPTKNHDETEAVGSIIANNPSKSPTDQMVNRLAEAERAMKNERRSQWLNMNQSSATDVLANLGAELPAHLRQEQANPAANIMAGAMGQSAVDGPSTALLRRISEVAVRRVARKRGVAVETPQTSAEGDHLNVNVTYVDDGRVFDTPEDLAQAFEHSIQTELALKGYDITTTLNLFCSKDGTIEKLIGDAAEEAEEEEMFACEICDGLVSESDNECPHCGAMFEDEGSSAPSGPPGPSGGGPSKSGGPPGPSRGGPSKSGGPPKKSGGPPGPSRGGPSKSGGPPKKSGGPPGPSKSGGPPKKSGGPPGPSKSGGPPKKSGGPPGPSKSGGPPKKSGGPPGPSKSGGPPKKSGGPPKGGPKGPKRGPP